MVQNKQQRCPVCGAVRDDAGGLGCTACGFRTAFVTHFSSPDALSHWRAEVERNVRLPLPLVQAMLSDTLTLDNSHVGILLGDACYQVDGVYAEVERSEAILQYSRGDRHTAALYRDGTVDPVQIAALSEIR